MITFNKDTLRDKIFACWIGKNIGGTLGGPYEWKREILDVKGFITPPGEPLPNDDLDLQLAWLLALREQGVQNINSKVLGAYWTTTIGPHWAEYGVSKANLRMGIQPPLSGSLYNEEWMNSNGAWIRTEIWACTNPGCVENAVRLAFEDASVDHGFGEGTYAAIFIAAMESAAFIFSDINVLIKIGLSKIPENCRVARSVRLAVEAYENGTDWKIARNKLVEDSADLEWFQAPANVGFVILGLLYGEGDFKKSMLLSINCGDDTDCTAATLGSIMGIMHGTKIIPEDWREHIGDKIVTICLINGFRRFPKTCTELTDAVMELIPLCTYEIKGHMNSYGKHIDITDGENDFSEITPESLCGDNFVKEHFNRSQYSFTAEDAFAEAIIEFPAEPVINAGGELECKVTVRAKHIFNRPDHYCAKWFLPEGWSVEGRNHLFVNDFSSKHTKQATVTFKIISGERVECVNRLVLELHTPDNAMRILAPVTILS